MQKSPRSRETSIHGRVFKMLLIKFVNGSFLTVSEGSEERLGALTMSLKLRDRVESTTIIPARYGEVFPTILAETAANLLQGMTITSLYLISGLDQETARGLLGEVKEFLKDG